MVVKKAVRAGRSAHFIHREPGNRSGDTSKRFGGLALQVSSLIRVDQVALGSFINVGSEKGTGLGGTFFVTSGDRGENSLAGRLETAFFRAVALGADDGLTCALDGRFVIGHGRFEKILGR